MSRAMIGTLTIAQSEDSAEKPDPDGSVRIHTDVRDPLQIRRFPVGKQGGLPCVPRAVGCAIRPDEARELSGSAKGWG